MRMASEIDKHKRRKMYDMKQRLDEFDKNIQMLITKLDKNLEYMYKTPKVRFKAGIVRETDDLVEEFRDIWIRFKAEQLAY